MFGVYPQSACFVTPDAIAVTLDSDRGRGPPLAEKAIQKKVWGIVSFSKRRGSKNESAPRFGLGQRLCFNKDSLYTGIILANGFFNSGYGSFNIVSG